MSARPLHELLDSAAECASADLQTELLEAAQELRNGTIRIMTDAEKGLIDWVLSEDLSKWFDVLRMPSEKVAGFKDLIYDVLTERIPPETFERIKNKIEQEKEAVDALDSENRIQVGLVRRTLSVKIS